MKLAVDMVLQEHKAKYEEQILPQYLKKLKERSYQNLDVAKLRDMAIEQMEESSFNIRQLWEEIDSNKNGVMDFLEDEKLKYLFEGLPTTEPVKLYFKKIESYFSINERQKEKIIIKLIESLDYANQTREVIKLVPVESTRMGTDEIDRFKAQVRGIVKAYKEDNTKPGKGVLMQELKNLATTDERTVWINAVAMEEMGEVILK